MLMKSTGLHRHVAEVKALLNEKKRSFRCGDREELRRVQKDLKYKIQSGKESLRRKMEAQP